jgi:dTMP kinase
LWPDLNVLIEVPHEVAVERLGRDRDRFERADDDFHRRVAKGFRALAADDPDRWVVVDGTPAVDVVAAAVRVAVEERLDLTT